MHQLEVCFQISRVGTSTEGEDGPSSEFDACKACLSPNMDKCRKLDLGAKIPKIVDEEDSCAVSKTHTLEGM